MPVAVGKDERFIKRITCHKCATINEYTQSEVRTLWSGSDYGGGPDGAEGFNCVSCGAQVITKRW